MMLFLLALYNILAEALFNSGVSSSILPIRQSLEIRIFLISQETQKLMNPSESKLITAQLFDFFIKLCSF